MFLCSRRYTNRCHIPVVVAEPEALFFRDDDCLRHFECIRAVINGEYVVHAAIHLHLPAEFRASYGRLVISTAGAAVEVARLNSYGVGDVCFIDEIRQFLVRAGVVKG